MVALVDSYFEPRATVWDGVSLYGEPFVHYDSVVMNPEFLMTADNFSAPFVHYSSYYGIEKAPDPNSIKAGVTYGFNDTLVGSMSISTEQWS